LALAPIPDAQPAPAPALIRLVEQLTADFATAERERGEAIGIGFMLAEQREQLTLERENLCGELAELRRELFALSDTALAWPVRRRLLALLQASVH